MIRCVRIWTGSDGNSHFEEGFIDLASGVRGDMLSSTLETGHASFQETRSGGTFEWHTAPVRQLVVTLSGTLDFQTRGGQHFILKRSLGGQPRGDGDRSIHVQVPAGKCEPRVLRHQRHTAAARIRHRLQAD